jgi:uncharacterized protein (DUF885 family)
MLLALAPILALAASAAPAGPLTPEGLRSLAHDFYTWSDAQSPVGSSSQGLHTWDDQLDDFSPKAIAARRQHVAELLATVRALDSRGWSRDDRVDAILFRSQLEGAAFSDEVLRPEETSPLFYVGVCTQAIFSLLEKEYAPAKVRARAATARLERFPALLQQALEQLREPVGLHARLAIASVRGGDELYTKSLMTLAPALSASERRSLDRARDRALAALHHFADVLEQRLPGMREWQPMGRAAYERYLHRVYLLPIDADQLDMLGRIELDRYRGLEALLRDPAMASPDPSRARQIPADQAAFLAAYQSREKEVVDFLQANRLVTLPPYLGPFTIRQLPEAFKPTSPGGFMNPPGVFDRDPEGFYFIPTYDPKSQNFYIRAAIEDPRPILAHEGIPGHFLQISIANHVASEIRRRHGDNVFVEGWALYGEEMLTREGLYPEGSAAQGQVLRLSRYRAARIGVDVNLHTGRWTFEQGVEHFMKGGGLDREAATGEAAGAAASPLQKIAYITGKWQILQLLGRYRETRGADFRLGEFHDRLISYGSLPLTVVTWLMLDDPGPLEQALAMP